MICPNCGKEAPGKFCPFCGMKITGDAPAVNAPETQVRQPAPNRAPDPGYRQGGYTPTQPQNPNPNPNPNPLYQNQSNVYAQVPTAPAGNYQQPAFQTAQNDGGETPAKAALRSAGRSGAFLMATLCMTLSLILTIVTGIMNMSNTSYLSYYYSSSAQTSMIISLVISALIIGGMVAALWCVYSNCKSGKPLKTGGLTTFKVYAIIGIVLLGIATAVLIVFLVIALTKTDISYAFNEIGSIMSQAGMSDQFALVSSVMWIGIVVLVLVLFLLFLLLGKIISSVNAAKRIIRTGNPDRHISAFLGVMCFIGFAFMVISLVLTVIQALGLPSYLVDWGNLILTSLLPMVVSIIGELCFGIVIFKARGGQKALMG